MNNEIERKFLIKEPPRSLEDCPVENIRQGYLQISENMEIRIRQRGDKYFQAVKYGAGLKRHEIENEIGQLQFEDMWPETEGRRIEKLRYEIGCEDFLVELDIYSGPLAGLITAEVEFRSERESALFMPPHRLGEDITHDERYKNKNLALYGIPL